MFDLLKGIREKAKRAWDEKLTDNGRAVRDSDEPLTWEKYSSLTGNSYDRVEYIKKLDNDALLKVTEHYLKNCRRYDLPGTTYDEVVIAQLLPRIIELAQKQIDALKVWEAINTLRTEEGSSVAIANDNHDFGGPNCAIMVTDRWTNYVEVTFYGDTVLAALTSAINDPRRLADLALYAGRDQKNNVTGTPEVENASGTDKVDQDRRADFRDNTTT